MQYNTCRVTSSNVFAHIQPSREMTAMTDVCSEYSTPLVVHRGRALSNLILIRVCDIDPVHFSAASTSPAHHVITGPTHDRLFPRPYLDPFSYASLRSSVTEGASQAPQYVEEG